eukprot:399161-Rhodomonas_salina.1
MGSQAAGLGSEEGSGRAVGFRGAGAQGVLEWNPKPDTINTTFTAVAGPPSVMFEPICSPSCSPEPNTSSFLYRC